MEQFLTDNETRYKELVMAFKPPRAPSELVSDLGRSNMTIVARLRPMLDHELAANMIPGAFTREDSKSRIDLHTLNHPVRGLPTLKSSHFQLDRVFGPGDSTEAIYGEVVESLVSWAWLGGVSTMFAYGQTGSGKTFTVGGLELLIAKSLMSNTLQGSRKIFVSVIELAGNSAFDLLDSRRSVAILEDAFGQTQLAGKSEYHATDVVDLVKHLKEATSFRSTAPTQKHDASSRSHAICTIRIHNPYDPQEADGLLYLVDLAGSEASRDVTMHSKERMIEAKEINMSLSVLKDCIRSRAMLDSGTLGAVSGGSGKKPYLPFRHSALTRILKHMFDPQSKRSSKTVVIACVNPNLFDVESSKNTLRYAELLRIPVRKTVALKRDANRPSTWTNSRVREWIKENSGAAAILPELLAPTETGEQLLCLPVSDFASRCTRMPGVTTDQATAFQAKFWRLHVDSQNPHLSQSKDTTKPIPASNNNYIQLSYTQETSSREPQAVMGDLPFKKRLRPGMVVSWDAHDDVPEAMRTKGRNLALVLSAERIHAAHDVRDAEQHAAFRCAVVLPAVLPSAFEVRLWWQLVVPVSCMNKEVLLEYDEATRYYYETL